MVQCLSYCKSVTYNLNFETTSSIVLTVEEHAKYTMRWLQQIGRRNMNVPINTKNAKLDDIWEAAQEVYHDAPELLEFIKTFLNK